MGPQIVKVRINKFIADSGFASRRKVEEYILAGRVEVNDKVVENLSVIINPEKDIVRVDGERIKPKRHLYFILHKPKGVITTTSDEKNRKTVVDLINSKEKIFPVGRLDYNTTGILFLTNDGDFSNFMTHPSNKVVKEYKVKLNRPLEYEDRLNLTRGIKLDGRNSRFEQIKPKDKSNTLWLVSTSEGRNHFVKRMFSKLGYTVTELHRVSIAGFTADSIPPGKFVEVKESEIRKLMGKYEK